MEYIGEYGTRNMICGVINQAVRDWKSAYYVLDGTPTEQECEEVLKKTPDDKNAKKRLRQIHVARELKDETEKFFKGDWFKELKEESGVALPKDMISALYERVEEEKKEKAEKEKKKHERELSEGRKRADFGQNSTAEVENADTRVERKTAQDSAVSDKDGGEKPQKTEKSRGRSKGKFRFGRRAFEAEHDSEGSREEG